jgi:hypothetical protein
MPSLQPVILPYSQIKANITNVFVAESRINDLNEGSSVNDYIEAAAMSDYRSQGNLIAILSSQNIDQATGSDLDKIGFAAGVPRPQSTTSSGFVTVGSSNITKVATQVYAGTAAPPAGSTAINIADGSAFPQSGSAYIGRGTSNLEGPLQFDSVVPIGNFFQLTLTTPTTKNHNVSESVILAQGGNRTISAGTTVQTTPNSTTAAVQYTTTASATVPDGEVSITNVPVICTQAGSIGNAGANTINQIPSQPFPSVFVTNPTTIINAQDYMSDPDYRNLIKASAQTKQKGTPLVIETVAVGVTSTDDNKQCDSANYLAPANRSEPGILYITSGVNYQPVIYGQGYEPIIDNANGSEKYLQLENEDITKATIISTLTAPFALTGNMALAVKVGGVLSTHIFQATDFATQNAATADEVAASINADTSITFSARAISNSTLVAIFAEAYVNEDIQVVTPVSPYTDANAFLGFSVNREYTLMLYENDILLYKDGVIPTALSNPQDDWNPLGFVSGCTFILSVDGTAPITLTFVDSDFNQFGYTVVQATNSLASWATLINQKMPGVTAAVSGNELQVSSNKGANSSASLRVVGGTLVTSGNMFVSATYQGVASDYALNRSTGQIELVNTLAVGASLSAGSQNTRGFVDSAVFPTGAVSLAPTANDAVTRLFVILDAPATVIPTLIPAGTNITVSNSGDNWTYTSVSSSAFTDVQVDDWALIQSPSMPDSDDNKGFWRVTAVTGSAITVRKVNGTDAVYVASGSRDVTVIRSAGLIQEIDFGSGTQTLGALVASVNSQLVGGFGSTQGATVLRIFTDTFNYNGSTFIAGFNTPASALGFTVGEQDQSTVSSTAFAESAQSEVTIPEFYHDTISADNGTVPPPVVDRTISTTANLDAVFPPNRIVSFLDAYANVSNNTGSYTLTGNIGTNTALIRGKDEIKDIITNDRYFVAAPFQLSGEDNLVVILDQDPINKSLNIQLFRNGTVSNQAPPTATTFTAYDTDNGPTSNYAQAFGNNYSFEDFKVLFKARQILDPSGTNNAMIVRFYKFGPTGNQVQVGLFYPTQPSSPVSSSVTVGPQTQVGVSLASSVSEIGGWSNTSQFNITNTSGNTWRYTWNGTGTAPNFTGSIPTPIAAGDIVTVSGSEWASDNRGTFRVTNVTSTYFEVTNPSGSVQSNVQLSAASDFTFYKLLASSNTATQVGDYINANLSNYISATQLESGAGTISTSTMDDTGNPYVSLVDGENWFLSTNVGTTYSPTNSFTLKRPMSLYSSSSPSYTVVGEPFRIVPVMAAHVSSFLNVFAVTGLSSLGNLSVSSSAGKLQIYSDLFGSAGSVNVTGGTGNGVTAAVLNSSFVVDSNYTSFDIAATDTAGITSGQWCEISNEVVQQKDIVFSGSTQMQVTASPGHSEVTVTSGPGSFQTVRTTSADATTQVKVEQQGQFVAFSWTGTGTAPNFTGGGLTEGDWVLVEGAFNPLNQGIYRVIKTFGSSTFYVQNESFVAETVTMSANSDLSFYSYDSAMPGDTLSIGNGVLGTANNGTYVIAYSTSPPVPFPTSSTVYVQATGMVNNGPTSLGSNANQVTVTEAEPFLAYRKIQNVALDPSNINDYSVVVQGSALNSKINVNVGSTMNLVGKFAFNTLVNSGVDSYKYYGGLIHAVGEVVRGEPFDPITFPGYAAAGSYLEIDVAIPLPITLSIVIRVVTGTPFSLLQSRVQSAVSSYINALGVNQPVVFSEIVSAANSVAGVQAVAIASPTYNASSTEIVVPPNQQAVVENAMTDIVVSLASG